LIKDELEDHFGLDALTHKVIDIQPKELHHQYQQGDEEGGNKRTYKGFNNQFV
jgi:hypothetical protein